MPPDVAAPAAVSCRVFSTGFCTAREADLLKGGDPRRMVECHSLVALLRHPRAGWLLWDAGYAPRLFEAATDWPYSLYLRATPVTLAPGRCAAEQVQRVGVAPEEVGRILVSHFHADHVGGLCDFPAARFVCAAEAWADVKNRRGLSALGKAVLPGLIPPDFAARAELLRGPFTGSPLPHLGPTHDLFGDGLLRLVRLPGHARGQLGLYAETEGGPLLFVADAAYTCRSIRECRPPHPRTNLFTDGGAKVAATLRAVHAFAAERPDVALVPAHCPEAYARFAGGKS